MITDNYTTIGMDVSDRKIQVCVMTKSGVNPKIVKETTIPTTKEGLQKLIGAGNRVYIVTATSPESFVWKMTWFKKYFPFFNTNNVIRMMDKSLFKCDILIEDCLEQLINHKLCHRVCLDYPWNQTINDNVYDI